MDPLEEQQQELEVIESIYPDELEKYSDVHFGIKVNLDTASDRNHALLLEVTYPERYPEVVPQLKLVLVSEGCTVNQDVGENGDDDGPLLATLSEIIEFLQSDLSILLSNLNEEAEQQLGMPSVFTLVTQLKDEAEELFQKNLDKQHKVYEDILLKKEREEQKKFQGTPVTKETWSEWRVNFRNERNVELIDRKRYVDMHQGKLTGKEIFEKGLAGNDEDGTFDISANILKLVV
ncbi:uncharacterized protein PRCAT00001310001 [Priceomyces carsonii]|uniref:uncharacterized protein n=1 Tax=Priceomyces carsonii TaxID=28549 RepID=UPI002ED8BF89|nr:unnamed protein product [Priceomyces carsonii]